MRLGVLYKTKPGQPLTETVKLAVINFNNAAHCGRHGHHPAEIRLNPDELPAELHLDGLAIHPDNQVRPGYIRITTCDLLPDYVVKPHPDGDDAYSEFCRYKKQFAQQVQQAAV